MKMSNTNARSSPQPVCHSRPQPNGSRFIEVAGATPEPTSLLKSDLSCHSTAARAGQGVALGWGRLVQDLLATGELVKLPAGSLPCAEAYYAVVPHGRTITPEIDALIAWLRDGVSAD